jgi:hypothetical protein
VKKQGRIAFSVKEVRKSLQSLLSKLLVNSMRNKVKLNAYISRDMRKKRQKTKMAQQSALDPSSTLPKDGACRLVCPP